MIWRPAFKRQSRSGFDLARLSKNPWNLDLTLLCDKCMKQTNILLIQLELRW